TEAPYARPGTRVDSRAPESPCAAVVPDGSRDYRRRTGWRVQERRAAERSGGLQMASGDEARPVRPREETTAPADPGAHSERSGRRNPPATAADVPAPTSGHRCRQGALWAASGRQSGQTRLELVGPTMLSWHRSNTPRSAAALPSRGCGKWENQ